ncbi:hypothetical protein L1049_008326 [Liquidambar formosana]|uniref:Uncharacterized protein n=1 Tax=Liquidambar formosana TaxID=63359 RepID=A0AAP0S3H6_LIQFO
MSNPDASQYWFKVIPNLEDIVDFCAKDQATGEGAENAEDADEVMSNEGGNEVDESKLPSSSLNEKRTCESSSMSIVPPQKKKAEGKDALSQAVAKMAASLDKYMRSSTKKLDVDEVYEEVNAIPDLDRNDFLLSFGLAR